MRVTRDERREEEKQIERERERKRENVEVGCLKERRVMLNGEEEE